SCSIEVAIPIVDDASDRVETVRRARKRMKHRESTERIQLIYDATGPRAIAEGSTVEVPIRVPDHARLGITPARSAAKGIDHAEGIGMCRLAIESRCNQGHRDQGRGFQ